MNLPEVSVIVPNYNHSAYLTQRIESILNQTFQDFEIILLDDFSTDDSRDILQRYCCHEKVSHIIFNNENSGSTFKQWEKGIKLSKGKFIWIAESDDWCMPTLLESLLSGIYQDKECVISYCQSYIINTKNEIKGISTHKCLSEVVDGKGFSKNDLLLTNPIFNASMVIWKRELFPLIAKDFKEYRLTGDWMFWMELSRFGKVHISGEILNFFRSHEKNVSTHAFKSGLNFIETLKVINSLYQRKIISALDYYKVFKVQFRNYYPVKKNLDPLCRKEIKTLFKSPLTSNKIYYMVLMSTIWKHIRRKEWSIIL